MAEPFARQAHVQYSTRNQVNANGNEEQSLASGSMLGSSYPSVNEAGLGPKGRWEKWRRGVRKFELVKRHILWRLTRLLAFRTQPFSQAAAPFFLYLIPSHACYISMFSPSSQYHFDSSPSRHLGH